jgi:hypothetical protein
MSANLYQGASNRGEQTSGFPSTDTAKTLLKHDRVISEQPGRSCDYSVPELVWVLIWIQILLYLATTYVFWAKIESAWPIFR